MWQWNCNFCYVRLKNRWFLLNYSNLITASELFTLFISFACEKKTKKLVANYWKYLWIVNSPTNACEQNVILSTLTARLINSKDVWASKWKYYHLESPLETGFTYLPYFVFSRKSNPISLILIISSTSQCHNILYKLWPGTTNTKHK